MISESLDLHGQNKSLPDFLVDYFWHWFPVKSRRLDAVTAQATLYAFLGKAVHQMTQWISDNMKRASPQMIQQASLELMRISYGLLYFDLKHQILNFLIA